MFSTNVFAKTSEMKDICLLSQDDKSQNCTEKHEKHTF